MSQRHLLGKALESSESSFKTKPPLEAAPKTLCHYGNNEPWVRTADDEVSEFRGSSSKSITLISHPSIVLHHLENANRNFKTVCDKATLDHQMY